MPGRDPRSELLCWVHFICGDKHMVEDLTSWNVLKNVALSSQLCSVCPFSWIVLHLWAAPWKRGEEGV